MPKKSNSTIPTAEPTDEEKLPDMEEPAFPVVGVGASAGGLDAFKLLKSLPADTGMAFVLVQHLDPKHVSLLPELLGRTAAMPLTEISDGMRAIANHVYVMPTNYSLAMLHGMLHLTPRPDEHSKQLRRSVRRGGQKEQDLHQEIGGRSAGSKEAEGLHQILQQERRMAAVVRDSNDAVTVQDFAGRIPAWNRRARAMFGYTEPEALQLNAGELIPETAQEKTRGLIERLKRGEHVTTCETRRRAKDGREIKVWLTASALLDESGNPAAIATTEKEI